MIHLTTLDTCVPITTREIKRLSAPWIKGELQLEIVDRDRIQMRLKKDRQNERLNSEYKQRKKHVSARISAARATYFKDEVKKSKSSKETWKMMNRMVLNRSNVKVEFDNPEEKNRTV